LVAGVVGLVADAVSTGLVVVTADGRVVWANRAMLGLVLPGGAETGEPGAGPGTETRSTLAPGALGWGAVHGDPVVAARFAVANAALPLARAGAGLGRHRWEAPDSSVRWLDIRRVELDAAGAGGIGQVGADGFVLYEITDVTDSHAEDGLARRREGHRDRVEAISRTGTWEWDLNTNQMTWSEQMRALIAPAGTTAGSQPVDYAEFHALLHPDDVEAVENALDAALRDGEPFAFVHRVRLPPDPEVVIGPELVPDGWAAAGRRERVFVCVGEVLTDELGMPARVVAASRDVTGSPDDPFAAAGALDHAVVAEQIETDLGTAETDAADILDTPGAVAGAVADLPDHDLPDHDLPDHDLPDHDGPGVDAAGVGLAGVGLVDHDSTVSAGAHVGARPSGAAAERDGSPADPVLAAPVPTAPVPTGLDALTGLPDRSALVARLRGLGTDEIGDGRLLVIDIDDFSGINDRHGHDAGDAVLRALAPLFADEAPRAEIYRLPGGRFAALLPGSTARAPADAAGSAGTAATEGLGGSDGHYPGMPLARRLVDLVAAAGARGPDGASGVSVSIGIAPLDGPRDQAPDAAGADDRAMLARGESAARRARAAGPGAVRIHDDEAERAALATEVIVERVRRAIDAGYLALDAQPVINLASREVHAYELLVRLRDGRLPDLEPGEFLAAIAATDLMVALDRWVVEQAVALLATSEARERHWQLYVNISGRSVGDPAFGEFVVATLRGRGVDPAQLGLEVSETAAGHLEALRELAGVVTGAGCRLALDDFGSGLGSVVYLRDLPFTSVKIDGGFLGRAEESSTDIMFIDAVVRIARTLGLYTIAENVDREELVDALEGLGVDYAQGVHLGRPRPLGEVLFGGESSRPNGSFADTSLPVSALPPRPTSTGVGGLAGLIGGSWADALASAGSAPADTDPGDQAAGDQAAGDYAADDYEPADDKPAADDLADYDPATMALYQVGPSSYTRARTGSNGLGAAGPRPVDATPAGAGSGDAGSDEAGSGEAAASRAPVSPAEPIAEYVTMDFGQPDLSGSSYGANGFPGPEPTGSGSPWPDDSFAGLSALGFPPPPTEADDAALNGLGLNGVGLNGVGLRGVGLNGAGLNGADRGLDSTASDGSDSPRWPDFPRAAEGRGYAFPVLGDDGYPASSGGSPYDAYRVGPERSDGREVDDGRFNGWDPESYRSAPDPYPPLGAAEQPSAGDNDSDDNDHRGDGRPAGSAFGGSGAGPWWAADASAGPDADTRADTADPDASDDRASSPPAADGETARPTRPPIEPDTQIVTMNGFLR
jgi:EAL domain-containing protein (putative c-di-GMP-specific phosphodiesterase class I)/GGDEF domain-containing protein